MRDAGMLLEQHVDVVERVRTDVGCLEPRQRAERRRLGAVADAGEVGVEIDTRSSWWHAAARHLDRTRGQASSSAMTSSETSKLAKMFCTSSRSSSAVDQPEHLGGRVLVELDLHVGHERASAES